MNKTDANGRPDTHDIGSIVVPTPGTYRLSVKPLDNEQWNGFRFQGLKIVPKGLSDSSDKPTGAASLTEYEKILP